ncbi:MULTISPECIES: DUF4166 domain-containing protein [Paenibacillus]|uniref:DUF4166 domain-containing protein n=1 Tax=Paenibacillus TaxID=44249 RepID=UPI0022B8664C|nr:DUF4166 domain-containing protein [Paenibacillus caseinilyticus]MCZ8521984.1 DUF4166 domain-containing protein [Paenibacillus caseinilyticus]
MSSIYERVLGSDFGRLHPEIRRRFGFGSEDGIASIGRGTMDRVWHGKAFTKPFLSLGAWRNIMFPQQGENVPFTIENYAYVDRYGRETVTWVRTFQFPDRERRFDATMVYSEQRGKIVDYLGTHQHLAVEIDMEVADHGGIRLRSGNQYFYEGWIGFRFPMRFSGYADVCEWFDEREGLFRIDVHVANPAFGPLFGYSGRFHAEYIKVEVGRVPPAVKPVREERRE